jgi:hypothetical protein
MLQLRAGGFRLERCGGVARGFERRRRMTAEKGNLLLKRRIQFSKQFHLKRSAVSFEVASFSFSLQILFRVLFSPALW